MYWFIALNWILDTVVGAPPLVVIEDAPEPQETESDQPHAVYIPVDDKENLAYLLNSLEVTFRHFRRTCDNIVTSRDVIAGLKRLGPLILPPHYEVMLKATRIDTSLSLPGMMFVAFNGSERLQRNMLDIATCEMMYAIRYDKPPWLCERGKGTCYECGGAFLDRKTGKLLWHAFYVVIDPDSGEVKPLRYRQTTRIKVPKSGSYSRTELTLDTPYIYCEKYCKTEQERMDYLANLFCSVHQCWHMQDDWWRVSFRRNNFRTTYCIEQSKAKVFFKDRKITALTPTGQRKRIIHYVSDHERVTPSGKRVLVKEHLRGLRKFQWRNYACAVTAPKFHTWLTDRFDVPVRLDLNPKVPALDTIQVGAMLADLEDEQDKRAVNKFIH